MMRKMLSFVTDNATKNAIIQFFKFGIVGLTNTFISYIVYVVTILLMNRYNFSWDYFLANMMGFLISVAWSFYWNNRFVFVLKEGEKRNWKIALIKTYISYSFSGIILCNILSFLWIDCLGISRYIAPVINLCLSVPINFIVNKLWAFRGEKKD